MANPVWGMLEKAQDNPQSILEAIDEKIAAHEADEEAHLGAGESLQSHRASEIIDHAAYSIVSDKYSDGSIGPDALKFILTSYFESLDGWAKEVSSPNTINPLLYRCIFTIYPSTDENLCYIQTDFGALPSDWSEEDIIFETALKVGSTVFDSIVMAGVLSEVYNGDEWPGGFGFYFNKNDTKIYAYYYSSSGPVSVAVLTNFSHVFYKLKVTMSNNTLKWYINDTLVHTVESPTFLYSDGAMVAIGSSYNNSSTTYSFTCRYVIYSQNQKY